MVHLVSFTNISDEFWPLTYLSRLDKPARHVCLSIQFSLYTWLKSNHHCIFTMLSSCTSHYYFGCQTFDLGWWPWPWLCLLPQNCKTCYSNTFWIKHHIHAIKGNIWWILLCFISFIAVYVSDKLWNYEDRETNISYAVCPPSVSKYTSICVVNSLPSIWGGWLSL